MSAIENAAAAYRAATDAFLEAARAVPASQLDNRHPEGWSARQVIHHLADAETVAYARFVRLLAEPEPVIRSFDEAVWAACPELGYTDAPVEPSIALFAAVRAKSASIIDRLSVADLERTGKHTERGTINVAQWLDMHTRHANEHVQQLQHATRSEL